MGLGRWMRYRFLDMFFPEQFFSQKMKVVSKDGRNCLKTSYFCRKKVDDMRKYWKITYIICSNNTHYVHVDDLLSANDNAVSILSQCLLHICRTAVFDKSIDFRDVVSTVQLFNEFEILFLSFLDWHRILSQKKCDQLWSFLSSVCFCCHTEYSWPRI